MSTTIKKSYMITGANSGLGFDATRQLALRDDVEKVYMACRSKEKAEQAMEDLVAKHNVNKDKLEFVEFDGSASKSEIEKAVTLPSGTVLAGIVLNAGGIGPDKEGKPTQPNNIIPIVQINIAGHAHLVEYLLKQGHIAGGKTRVIFSGSEASRGIKIMGMKAPLMEGDTPEYYQKFLNGSVFADGTKYDPMAVYGQAKSWGILYFSAWARAHADVFVLTVSPGGTKGTSFAAQDSMNPIMRRAFPVVMSLLGMFGYFHELEVGAKRYVDAVTNEGEFTQFTTSGAFIASKSDAASGPVADQVDVFDAAKQYGDVKKQDALYAAMSAFL